MYVYILNMKMNRMKRMWDLLTSKQTVQCSNIGKKQLALQLESDDAVVC